MNGPGDDPAMRQSSAEEVAAMEALGPATIVIGRLELMLLLNAAQIGFRHPAYPATSLRLAGEALRQIIDGVFAELPISKDILDRGWGEEGLEAAARGATRSEIQREFERLTWLHESPYVRPLQTVSMLTVTAGRALGWVTGQEGPAPSVVIVQHLVALLEGHGIRCCRRCACTEDYACPGGCSWSESDPGLCTRCEQEKVPK